MKENDTIQYTEKWDRMIHAKHGTFMEKTSRRIKIWFLNKLIRIAHDSRMTLFEPEVYRYGYNCALDDLLDETSDTKIKKIILKLRK
jgi:hypothetical protein